MFNWPKILFKISFPGTLKRGFCAWSYQNCIKTVLEDSMLFIDGVTAEKPMILTQEGRRIFFSLFLTFPTGNILFL